MKATISKIFGAGEETPLRSSHQDSGGEGVQLDRLLVQQKKTHLVRREHVQLSMQLFLRDNIEL